MGDWGSAGQAAVASCLVSGRSGSGLVTCQLHFRFHIHKANLLAAPGSYLLQSKQEKKINENKAQMDDYCDYQFQVADDAIGRGGVAQTYIHMYIYMQNRFCNEEICRQSLIVVHGSWLLNGALPSRTPRVGFALSIAISRIGQMKTSAQLWPLGWQLWPAPDQLLTVTLATPPDTSKQQTATNYHLNHHPPQRPKAASQDPAIIR